MKKGYKFQSSDADWSDPFPTVSMRTDRDDFWMDAITGVVDKEKGEGLASIGVTSPCFTPSAASSADPASFQRVPLPADEQAERRALGHSSRIYDVLRLQHAPAREGEGLATYQEGGDTYAHHAWSTQPAGSDKTVQALERAQAYFESAGWAVRHVPTATGAPALLARNAADGTVSQLAPSVDGTLRVGVTTPVVGPGVTTA